MTRRKRVMISSTARDLPEHREQVRLACERAGFAPHDMMEHLTALDADAIEASLKMVDEADVYVGVFAYRYGYVPDGHDASITEMEYDRAVELNKPRLIFFIHEEHMVTGKDIETGPGAAKLDELKGRIGKARVAAFFKTPDDLRACVIEALTKLRETLDAGAPGDAVVKSVATLHRMTSIPAPPEPFIAHPYTLLQLRDLIGRQAELNLLTDWVAKPGREVSDARVFCFVAIGGMGKSALAWKWFNQIAPNEMTPLAGQLWWSFYESDATFENFLQRGLCYVSGESESTMRALTWQQREALLLDHLSNRPYLFVLDGLERILISYNRMDASHLADDAYDEQTANYVAGAVGLPSSAAQSFVGQHRLRNTTDPRAGAFLQKLAQVAQSRILITTRLYPSALQLPTGALFPGCFAVFLTGLSDDDALVLWRALGGSGSRSELVSIFRSVESHPLLVQALASQVANYRVAPGDFAQWRADHPQFDPTSLPLDQSRTHILEFALQGLLPKVLKVLHTLVSFRMPASYATLEALLVGADKACGSAQELDQTLTELEDRGLIGWDRQANRYDAHPIVRGVVGRLATAKDRRAVLTALETHFESMAVPDPEMVETLADLTPAIERYYTLVGLGRYDEACGQLRFRLREEAIYNLFEVQQVATWLLQLFPEGEAEPPQLTREDDQIFALNTLAFALQHSGEPNRAVPLYQRTAEIMERRNDNELGILLRNSGENHIAVGELREATRLFIRALTCSRKLKTDDHESEILLFLSKLFRIRGQLDLAQVTVCRSKVVRLKLGKEFRRGPVDAAVAEMSLQQGDVLKAIKLADSARADAEEIRITHDIILSMILQGRAALDGHDMQRADELVHLALNQARAVNAVEFELQSLILVAQLKLKLGDLTEAKSRLCDIWETAKHGPYPLHQADAYNLLADIAVAEGDTPGAIDAATKAYKAAWCDGPPYAYHWGVEESKRQLATLGAPEPDMPPFDESKFEPLPEIEINLKDEYWVDPDKLD